RAAPAGGHAAYERSVERRGVGADPIGWPGQATRTRRIVRVLRRTSGIAPVPLTAAGWHTCWVIHDAVSRRVFLAASGTAFASAWLAADADDLRASLAYAARAARPHALLSW